MSEFRNYIERAYKDIEMAQSAELELYNKLDTFFSELHTELVQLHKPTKRFTVTTPEITEYQTKLQNLFYTPQILPGHTIFDENGWTIFGGEDGYTLAGRVDVYFHDSEVFMLESGKVALYDRGGQWISDCMKPTEIIKLPPESVYKNNDHNGVIVDSVTAYKFLLEKAQQIQRMSRYNNYDSILELIKPNILKLMSS